MHAVLSVGRAPLGRATRRPLSVPEEEHAATHGGHAGPSHGQAVPAGAALLWIDVHLRDSMSVAHLSHVFAP